MIVFGTVVDLMTSLPRLVMIAACCAVQSTKLVVTWSLVLVAAGRLFRAVAFTTMTSLWCSRFAKTNLVVAVGLLNFLRHLGPGIFFAAAFHASLDKCDAHPTVFDAGVFGTVADEFAAGLPVAYVGLEAPM